MMANKSILFNTEMVQAIQAGRKTQTRRVCKGQGDCNPVQCGYHPPYKSGDILWVRETWHRYTKRVGEGEKCRLKTFFGYKASIANSEDASEPWKPSIHMPKEAARIFLRVKDVRVERLLDITEEDAVREGCHVGYSPKPNEYTRQDDTYVNTARDHFFFVWEATVKPTDWDVYGIIANPWVWVIEFERCEKPEGWCE